MLLVRWLALWDQRDAAKTYLNLFASARHVAAPYPVLSRLTIVGASGCALLPVTLEGAKVNEPLQVCLDEVFPSVRGVAGVIVELLPTRRSLDLSLSRCVVERTSSERSVRYLPWGMPIISRPARSITEKATDFAPRLAYPLHRNPHENLSVIAINGLEESVGLRVGLRGIGVDSSIEVLDRKELESVVAVNVPGGSFVEFPLRCQQDKVAVSLPGPRNEEVAVYIVGRYAATGDIRMAASF
jgi:hypothetical protein